MKIRSKTTGAEFEVPDGTPPAEYGRFDPAKTGEIKRPSTFTERVQARGRQGSLMPFTTEAVSGAAKAVAPHVPVPPKAQEAIAGAEGGVPQGWTDLAILLSTLPGSFASGVVQKMMPEAPAAARWIGRTLRILTTTGAGAGAEALQGKDPLEGAKRGVVAGTVGEGIGKAVELGGRGAFGSLQRARDLKGLAKTIHGIEPDFPEEAMSFGRTVRGEPLNPQTQEVLQTAFSKTMDTAVKGIEQGTQGSHLMVPAVNEYLNKPAGTALTWPEVYKAYRAMGESGYLPSGGARSVQGGNNTRALRSAASQEIADALKGQLRRPDLALQWEGANDRYGTAQALLAYLRAPEAYQGRGVRLGALQERLDTPQTGEPFKAKKTFRQRLGQSLEPEDRAALQRSIFRGPETGEVDKEGLIRLSGHLGSHFNPWFYLASLRSPRFAGQAMLPARTGSPLYPPVGTAAYLGLVPSDEGDR